MDQLIPPTKNKYHKFLPLLPILLLIILLFGKEQNRTILKGQIAYMMTDKVGDLERIHKDLEDVLLRTMFYPGGFHNFVDTYEKEVQNYPQYETEITMLATHIARTYGGEFVVWKDETGKQISLYGIPENEVPNVDELPYFGDCENLSKIGRAICSENQLRQFIEQELKYPEGAKHGGVTVEIIINSKGDLSYLEAITSDDVDEAIRKEALRVVNKMPKWQPALRAGKPVDCTLYIPFIFETSDVSPFLIKKINTDIWKSKDSENSEVVPLFKMNKAQASIQETLTKFSISKSNKERKFHAIQFSKTVRDLLLNYPDYEEELTALFLQECKFYDLTTTLMFDDNKKLVDMQIEVEDQPEASYNDEDEIYRAFYEMMQSYEKDMSARAELDLEQQLGNIFWDFISRFPDDVLMAQTALQHACNSKKISTHTVKIQKEEFQVTIDLVGRKR